MVTKRKCDILPLLWYDFHKTCVSFFFLSFSIISSTYCGVSYDIYHYFFPFLPSSSFLFFFFFIFILMIIAIHILEFHIAGLNMFCYFDLSFIFNEFFLLDYNIFFILFFFLWVSYDTCGTPYSYSLVREHKP